MKTRLLPWVGLVVALAGTMGSLSLSWVLGLKACPLCFYQRAFVMGAVGVMGVGLASGMGKMKTLSLIALPVSVAGLCVALFHVSLELRGILECPEGLFGLGTAPKQSLAIFVMLTAILGIDGWGSLTRPAWFGAIALGAILGISSCTSNPPLPPPPEKAYAASPDICRRPFFSSMTK
jgi:disulfide bond formation protein DsbB